MAFLLRGLLVIMFCSITLTGLLGMGLVELPLGHIQVSIPTFLFTIFAQAFVMFYFIGVARLVENIHNVLNSSNLKDLFEDEIPEDLTDYHKKVNQFVYTTKLSKRQTIPWTALMLLLGMIAFLLGGAFDTGMVSRPVHSGVAYGFFVSMCIGLVRQWYYLGKSHKLLRKVKYMFSLSDDAM